MIFPPDFSHPCCWPWMTNQNAGVGFLSPGAGYQKGLSRKQIQSCPLSPYSQTPIRSLLLHHCVPHWPNCYHVYLDCILPPAHSVLRTLCDPWYSGLSVIDSVPLYIAHTSSYNEVCHTGCKLARQCNVSFSDRLHGYNPRSRNIYNRIHSLPCMQHYPHYCLSYC